MHTGSTCGRRYWCGPLLDLAPSVFVVGGPDEVPLRGPVAPEGKGFGGRIDSILQLAEVGEPELDVLKLPGTAEPLHEVFMLLQQLPAVRERLLLEQDKAQDGADGLPHQVDCEVAPRATREARRVLGDRGGGPVEGVVLLAAFVDVPAPVPNAEERLAGGDLHSWPMQAAQR